MASFGDWLGKLIAGTGKAVKAPEFGISELITGRATANPQTQEMAYSRPSEANAAWVAANTRPAGGRQLPGATTGGSGATGASGYGSYGYVDPTAAQVSALRGEVQGQRGTLDNLYGQLFGQTQGLAQEQRNNIDTQAAQDRAAMEGQYVNAQNQIGSMFGARGAYDSSYRANEQNAGTQSYQKSLGDYNKNVEQSYGKVGEQYNKQYTAFRQQQDQINQLFDQAAQAGDVSTLAQIKDALLGHIQGLQETSSGLRTNSQYAQQLKQVAPDATQVSKALSEKLQKLVTSSAPPEAKAAIAQGYISSAQLSDPNAQSYWNNYFQQLLTQTQAPQAAAPVGV